MFGPRKAQEQGLVLRSSQFSKAIAMFDAQTIGQMGSMLRDIQKPQGVAAKYLATRLDPIQ
jgi:hypothetical protein